MRDAALFFVGLGIIGSLLWIRRELECIGWALCLEGKGRASRLNLIIGPVTNKERTNAMDVKITNEQKVKVTLNPKTDTGKSAELDGIAKWSVVDGTDTSSTVVPAADGLSAELVSSDTPGDTTFLIEADADLGEGVETLQETITLTVAGALAKNLGITIGQPEPKEAV